MKVILLEEVRGKGGEGDIVEVNRGFANNYLLRTGKAVKATPGNLRQLEQRRKNIAKREEVRIAEAESLKAQLEGTQIIVKARVGEEGQLFGSVTTQMVADGIKAEKDIDIDRRRIDIRRPIKAVGEYEVEISLYRDIKAQVSIIVVDENIAANDMDAAVKAALEGGDAGEAVETAEVAKEAEEAAENAGESAEVAGEVAEEAEAMADAE